MGRCAMIWTTAGTNRVCSRCLALKDTVVGYTDELGVLLPPLHPRCRCAIMYDEVGTPRAMQPKPTINPLLPAAVATEIISPATPEPQTEPRESTNDFNFDIQRFGTYEDQVKSHGGSGNIKPDQVINARKVPKTAEPLSIIDHIGKDGKIDKRTFYDEEGKIYFDVHTTHHNYPKQHPFGNHGEHAHDITWKNGQPNWPKGRNLSDAERKDNGDII